MKGHRYFLYIGNNRKLFNLYLEEGCVYHGDTITHDDYTLLEYINFSIINLFDMDDFIELGSINYNKNRLD